MCVTTQQQVLDALGGGCLTLDELAEMLPGRTRQAVAVAMSRLARRDFVERVEAGCFRRTPFGQQAIDRGEVIDHGGSDGAPSRPLPPKESLRQRAWVAIRMARKFSAGELQIVAASGEERQAGATIRRFCSELVRAGVIRRLPDPALDGSARFVLVRDLGQTAPARKYRGGLRQPVLIDHNSGTELPL